MLLKRINSYLLKLGLCIPDILPDDRFALALFLLGLMAFLTLYVLAFSVVLALSSLRLLSCLSPILLTLSSLGLLDYLTPVLLRFSVTFLALLNSPVPSILLTLRLLNSPFSTLLRLFITSLVLLGFLVSSLLVALPSFLGNCSAGTGSPPCDSTFLFSVFFLVFSSNLLLTVLFESLFLTVTTWGFIFCSHFDSVQAHLHLTSLHAHRRLTPLSSLPITFVIIIFSVRNRSPTLQALGFRILRVVLIDSIAHLSLGISLSLSKLNLYFVFEPIFTTLTSIRTHTILTARLKQGVGFPGLLTFFFFLLLAVLVFLQSEVLSLFVVLVFLQSEVLSLFAVLVSLQSEVLSLFAVLVSLQSEVLSLFAV